jgi:hypothetical protein
MMDSHDHDKPNEGGGLPPTINVSLRHLDVTSDRQAAFWDGIRAHTERISFPHFERFVHKALCDPGKGQEALGRSLDTDRLLHACQKEGQGRFNGYIPGVDLYAYLKVAAEIFLLLHCGTCQPPKVKDGEGRASDLPDDIFFGGNGETGRNTDALIAALINFLGRDRHSYIDAIIRNVYGGEGLGESPFCPSAVSRGPCLIELIWSYWHEEAMLAQTTTAIALRFQNVARQGRDPLAELELSPLRPLSGFLWGYIQDESNRLSVARRSFEYQHEYGLGLAGKAATRVRPADSRSKFLQAFHDLLRLADQFYREAADNTVTPDPFPILIALRDLHMILAEGAHNQFRDLPWTARCEMLIQQWLLSRNETRDFLRGRVMVPYPEEWMAAVDAMKRLQGWPDTNSIHFSDLARFGERLLLSIRHVRCDVISTPVAAQDWALAWRPEIQGYIHAYRMATGVMLSDDVVEVNRPDTPRYAQPSSLLRSRWLQQRRQRRLGEPAMPRRLSLPARARSIAEK